MGEDQSMMDMRHSPYCTWYLDGVCDCEELVGIIVDIPEEDDVVYD
jgi:hypothetical protein